MRVYPLSSSWAVFNGIPRDRSRGSLRPTQREERFVRSKTEESCPLSQRIVVRVRGRPGASHLVQLVAGNGIRTAVGEDARRLFREMLSRIHHFSLQRDLTADVFTKLDLAHMPGPLSHFCLLTMLEVYRMADNATSFVNTSAV